MGTFLSSKTSSFFIMISTFSNVQSILVLCHEIFLFKVKTFLENKTIYYPLYKKFATFSVYE